MQNKNKLVVAVPGQLCIVGLPDGTHDVGSSAVVMMLGVWGWGGQGSLAGPGTTFDYLCGTGILPVTQCALFSQSRH